MLEQYAELYTSLYILESPYELQKDVRVQLLCYSNDAVNESQNA